jgi:DNA-binding XRE family transcriptional regulator
MGLIMDNLSNLSNPEIPLTGRRVLGQWVQEQKEAAMSDRNPISERTRRARLAVGLTQEEVATHLGVTKDAYAKWENRGKSTMPDAYKAAFCTLVRVSPSWLITGHSWPNELHQEPPETENARARKREAS